MLSNIINLLLNIGIFVMVANYFTMNTEAAPWIAGLILLLMGVGFYFLNSFLIHYYIKKEMPESLDDDSWEITAGLGIVPRWVSFIGLLAISVLFAGLVWLFYHYFYL